MPRVESVELAGAAAPSRHDADLTVRLEDGTSSSFVVATPQEPARRLAAEGVEFMHGTPVLFAASLEPGAVRRAVDAMADEMGGYWLRYYRSPARRQAAGPAPPVRTADLAHVEPAGRPEAASGVVETALTDGRLFSILAATPAWFEEAFARNKLPFYFGPLVLFVRRIEPALCRRAVEDMSRGGDLWLCLYDTPRRTLDEVLADFAARHR